jgi:hypothetical protein
MESIAYQEFQLEMGGGGGGAFEKCLHIQINYISSSITHFFHC